MLQYIIAFSLYTLAMVGIFFIAFVVYKKTMNFNGPKINEGMKIEDMLRLSQRKILYIINVQGERFLIASDPENTTFLAKLASSDGAKTSSDSGNKNISEIKNYLKDSEGFRPQENTSREQRNFEKIEEDYSNAINIKSKNAVMKNILRELENNAKRTNI